MTNVDSSGLFFETDPVTPTPYWKSTLNSLRRANELNLAGRFIGVIALDPLIKEGTHVSVDQITALFTDGIEQPLDDAEREQFRDGVGSGAIAWIKAGTRGKLNV